MARVTREAILHGRKAAAWACVIASASLGFSSARARERKIEGVSNVEDLAPLPGGRWVLGGSGVGGSNRTGWIALVDRRTGSVRNVYPSSSVTGHRRSLRRGRAVSFT
jgi:hypothetical protein